MILMIDNYDSFTFNLVQMLGEMEPDLKVIRNDEMSLEEIESLHPSGIVLSPGPGRPADAGICKEVIDTFGSRIPILGVCLGHQAIFEQYGGTVTYAPCLMHGKQSDVSLDPGSPLFEGLDPKIPVARYHSLAGDPDTLPDCLKVTAKTDDGVIMAVEHKTNPVYGVQFHPESILTPQGKTILKNYLNICERKETEND